MQIVENKDLNLKEIKSDDGKYLTLFNEDNDDIKDFYSTTVMYCPMSFDNSLVKEIDDEQNNAYLVQKETAIEAEMKAREAELSERLLNLENIHDSSDVEEA